MIAGKKIAAKTFLFEVSKSESLRPSYTNKNSRFQPNVLTLTGGPRLTPRSRFRKSGIEIQTCIENYITSHYFCQFSHGVTAYDYPSTDFFLQLLLSSNRNEENEVETNFCLVVFKGELLWSNLLHNLCLFYI